MALRDDELTDRLQDIESDLVERKESFSDKEKVCQAVCASANDLPDYRRPGVVFVGATDNGHPGELGVTDQLLQQLGAIRSDLHLLPYHVVQRPDGRDPTVVEAMRALEYVQRFGICLQLVPESMTRNGNPPAEFQAEATHVNVTLRVRS